MDREGFLKYLKGKGLDDDAASRQMCIADHLDTMLSSRNGPPGTGCGRRAALSLIDSLLESGEDSFENMLAILRYGFFTKNDEVYQTAFMYLDGVEALDGMYGKLEEVAGPEERDRIFGMIGPISPGTSFKDKASATRTVVAEVKASLTDEQRDRLYDSSFRHLEDSHYIPDRDLFERLGDVDAYIEEKKKEFIRTLEEHMAEGRPFFGQEITPQVIAYVKSDPEIAFGRREGSELFVTKIPFRTKEWLAEEDPRRRRYLYCHCPWARESILSEEGPVDSEFCRCSAGFHKKSWEVIFGRKLGCEVLESVLAGDARCRFRISLPL